MQKVSTANFSEWQPLETVPLGHKMLLLTDGGTAVIGVYPGGVGYVAWAPLPKRPDWLKKKKD
jgi:hypothetical protein